MQVTEDMLAKFSCWLKKKILSSSTDEYALV